MKRTFLFAAAALAGLSAAAQSQATPITVGNHSFESPAIGTDFTSANPTGWLQAPGPNGVSFNPDTTLYSGSTGAGTPTGADGTNIAIAFNGGWLWKSPSLNGDSQPTIVIAEGTYTLTLAVGQRIGGTNVPVFVQFRADAGDPINGGGGTFTSGNFLSGINDTFQDFSFALVVPNASPLIGQNLGFGIFTTGGAGFGSDFDNVRLDFAPIPEPSSLAMMLFAAIALAPFARRRKGVR